MITAIVKLNEVDSFSIEWYQHMFSTTALIKLNNLQMVHDLYSCCTCEIICLKFITKRRKILIQNLFSLSFHWYFVFPNKKITNQTY